MGGEEDFGGKASNPIVEALDRQIREAEAEVEALKARREAALLPPEPTERGAVIKQAAMVPAFRRGGGGWSYVTSPEKTRTWSELLRYGGNNFDVLYSL